MIADDFQGTATDGHRYDKAEAIATDPKVVARDCQLGQVKVRFFGDSIAIAYGAENRIRKAAGGKEARRCQVWTDTWLKRNEQWQIIAAQDTVYSMPPMTSFSSVVAVLGRCFWLSCSPCFRMETANRLTRRWCLYLL